MRLFTPSDGPLWLRRFSDSILGAFKQVMDAPFRLWTSNTTDLPSAGDYTGGLAWNADVSRVTYSDGAAWQQVQPWDPTLAALAAYNANGLLTQTAADMFAGRAIVGPAAGLSVANGDGVAGNPTLGLANDLAALEGLAGTGLARRTGADAWSVGGAVAVAEGGTGGSAASGTLLDNISGFAGTGLLVRTGAGAYAFRSLAGPAAGLSISNGGGAAGNPTIALANDLAALEALGGTNTLYYRSGADAWSAVAIGTNLGFAGGTLGSSLGTAATAGVGQSGAAVPLCNGAAVAWANGASFGGTVSTIGLRDSGALLARFEGSGGSVPAGATGVGLELYQSAGSAFVQSYNRTVSASAPINFNGSGFNFQVGAATIGSIASAGLSLGNATSTSTASPIRIDLGGTYSSAAGANPKLKLYNDGTAFYAIGVSVNQLDYIGANSASGHVFYHGAFKSASIEQISGRSGGALKLYGTSPAINLDTSAGVAGIVADVNAGVTAIGGNYLAISVPAGKAISLVVNNVAIADVTGTGVAIVSGTTASAANVFQSASGAQLLRSTSSMRFKQDVRPLGDEEADRLLLLDPFTYRSRCAADDRRRRHWGLSAEQALAVGLGKLVHREADGTPAGFMYERAVAGLIRLLRRERAARAALEARMAAAERALASFDRPVRQAHRRS